MVLENILSFDIDVVQRNFNEWMEKLEECGRKNHEPYKQQVINPYRPGKSTVAVICTNCRYIYERRPTREEIQSYSRLMRSEITI